MMVLNDAFGESLPPEFFTRVNAQALPDPYWVAWSSDCAALLDLPKNPPLELLDAFTGNAPFDGSKPLASVYSGHQFGQWAGQLGDGRALLLGNHQGPRGDLEIQLKGAGKTPYSRMGDGRAVLRSSIREYLCSEAMHALGVPSTRALSITGSDTPIFRENVESAAVVARVAPSFVRFGHFEHWYYNDQPEHLKTLADYVIERYFPASAELHGPARYQAFLQDVAERTASLVAHWQAIGFCHGVLNTDNMSILGLTLDYGPFGFMEGFDVHHICNHTDSGGRYAYSQQPGIGEWNCYALGQCFVELAGGVDEVKSALNAYREQFQADNRAWGLKKLGLSLRSDETQAANDEALMQDLLAQMHESRADFTLVFRDLSALKAGGDEALKDRFIDREKFAAWQVRYCERLRQEHSLDAERHAKMTAVNPKFVLRNYLAEQAIRKAADERDYTEISRLMAVLRHPFDEQPGQESYAKAPPDWAANLEVSCSS